MKKTIDKNIDQKMVKNLDWIEVLKGKIIKIEGNITETNTSLEETFSLVSELLEQFNILSVNCKIKQDDYLAKLTKKILSNIEEIKLKNFEQKQEMLEAKKYVEKSISYLRSFYDKVTKDSLTGLWNKEYINNVLDILYEQDIVPNFFYIFIDLDNLKITNDTYGHEAGDKLIITFAKYLRGIFGEDLNYIARIQGDEFNIISLDEMAILLKKINKLKTWCENNKIRIKDEKGKEHKIGISYSLGYSTSMEAKNVAELVRLADKRMYKEKYSKKSYSI